MYNIDSLLNGIEACKRNIQTFEDAIQKERDTIKEYYGMIEAVEKSERFDKAKAAIEANFKAAVTEGVKDADSG